MRLKKFVWSSLLILLLCFSCEECFRRKIGGFAGSYPFAESWELHARATEVLQAIDELKREQAVQFPPIVESYTDNYLDSCFEAKRPRSAADTIPIPDSVQQMLNRMNADIPHINRNYVDFYYSDTKEIVHSFVNTRPDSEYSTIVLVSFRDSTASPYSHRFINRDYWLWDNLHQIHTFQERVVDQVKVRLGLQ